MRDRPRVGGLGCREFDAALDLGVDMIEQRGVERGALAALRRHDLLGRALISSHLPGVLDRVRALEPTARTGLSVGRPLQRRLTGLWDWKRVVADALARLTRLEVKGITTNDPRLFVRAASA